MRCLLKCHLLENPVANIQSCGGAQLAQLGPHGALARPSSHSLIVVKSQEGWTGRATERSGGPSTSPCAEPGKSVAGSTHSLGPAT